MEKELLKQAKKIAKESDVAKVWVNNLGEFFTNENRALLSVKGDTQKIECAEFSADDLATEAAKPGAGTEAAKPGAGKEAAKPGAGGN